jgi:hypothetical protein
MAIDLDSGTIRWESRPDWRLFGLAAGATSRRLLFFVAAMGLLACAYVLAVGWQQHLQAQQATARLEALTRTQPKHLAVAAAGRPNHDRAATSAHGHLTPEQMQVLREAGAQINTPWPELLDQIERTTPADLGLLSMDVQTARGVLRLEAEARSMEHLLVLAHGLQHQGALGRLNLISQGLNERHAARPIRLTFELSVLPPSLTHASPFGEGGVR